MSSQRIDQCRTLAACGQTPWLHWPAARPAAPPWPAGAPTARRPQRWQLMQGRLCTWCFKRVLAMAVLSKSACNGNLRSLACRAQQLPCRWGGGAVRAVDLRRRTSSYLCDASAIWLQRPPRLAACKTLASGALWRRRWTRINRFRALRSLRSSQNCCCFRSRCCLARVRCARG